MKRVVYTIGVMFSGLVGMFFILQLMNEKYPAGAATMKFFEKLTNGDFIIPFTIFLIMFLFGLAAGAIESYRD